MSIQAKRIYERPAKTDGPRILVDRLWPRGVAKAKARVTLWAKDLAPSAEEIPTPAGLFTHLELH